MSDDVRTRVDASRGVPVRNLSPWTTREKVGRLLWSVVQSTLFRLSFHDWYAVRRGLLRLFGARLGRNVRIRRTVRIEIPWHLDLGDDVSIGDDARLYALGPIRIGERSFLSQMSHLCAGTHDHTDPDYPLLRPPIVIGADCWIAADAFVGPGVTIGDGVVVGARSGVFTDLPPWTICVGNPARPIKPRRLRGRHEPDA